MQIQDGESLGLERQRRARRANEQRASSIVGTDTGSLSVACECGDPGCAAELTVSRTAYQNVRRQARWFLVLDGHQRAHAQRVVRMGDAFLIVETGTT